jgi:membrane protein
MAGSGWSAVKGAAGAVRRRLPFIDHAVRAYSRYTTDGGDRLSAAATYFAFLSFFPLIALAFSVVGFVVDAYPSARDDLTRQINSYLPGLADKLDVSSIGDAKIGAGLVGLAGLMLAGLGWIDALRDAIRLIWHQDVAVGNLVTRRLRDLRVLGGLGLTLLASLVVTSLSTSATGSFLRWIGLAGGGYARWITALLALAVALAIDMVVFLYIFLRLPGHATEKKIGPWSLPEVEQRRRIIRAAALGAVGIEILKLLGTWLVGRTTANPVYGAFAVIVGLLIWINIVMRWTLFVAAWAVTAPYDSDVPPSGSGGTDGSVDAPEPAASAGTASPVGSPASAPPAPPVESPPAPAPGPGPSGVPEPAEPARSASGPGAVRANAGRDWAGTRVDRASP